jgi:hypothetical protein
VVRTGNESKVILLGAPLVHWRKLKCPGTPIGPLKLQQSACGVTASGDGANGKSVRIEIAAAEIDALVKRGYVDPNNRDDPAAIGEAATAFISDALFGL